MTAGAGRPAVLRRALRITLAALAGFYPLLYAAERPVAALYALFAPIAVGLLSAIPGSGRRQALVVLRVLPPALALAALGTALAVDTWAASGGMLAVGFLLAFAAVAGPRAAGAAPGLQLFYILACFPPYDPDSLGDRLTGLTVGILLLAATEILLPDPSVPAYRQRLADAVGTAARGASGAGGRRRPSEKPARGCASPGSRRRNAPPARAGRTVHWSRPAARYAGSWTSWPPSPSSHRQPTRHPPPSSATSRRCATPARSPCAPVGPRPCPERWRRPCADSRRSAYA